ncbi:MAG TPA: aminotransferase class III-fold pyridoxal phosphate-dependent enzyme [Vicinamibacterales bacterium]|nr:aminotransferase class III-fold pyridoxal phosphate-dependent enzyme [Vicinamibacterales bacterium]
MTGDEIVALAKRHTLFEWAAQGSVDPLPVARAQGIYFWTPEGRQYIDFNSQLMSVNIGHGDPRVLRAMSAQLEQLAFASPSLATEPRARLGARLAQLAPGDIDVFFFTTGGADANEHAFKIARAVTGRPKILARYRSYHGASGAAISVSGDPRRWSQPAYPGVVHVLDPYHGIQRGWDSAEASLRYLEEVIQLEGPGTIAAFILEPVTGTNGILVPPEGYLQGVRTLCDRYGILMIADEVMSGFGRTGEWFAVNHWQVVPDLLTMAKGLTSSYAPLGAVGMRRAIADRFTERPFPSGMTYGSHPLGCATALAVIDVMEQDDLVAHARERGRVLAQLQQEMASRHPSVGAVRSIGLFGIIELVRNRSTLEPLAPFNGTSPEMTELTGFFRQEGLFTYVRWNTFFTNPPLIITDDQLREAFAIIDRGLAITDRAVAA